jgi:hypothetical protein
MLIHCGRRLASLLPQDGLPASQVGRAPSKLLRSDRFLPGYAYRVPAFCQKLPAFPKIAGRDENAAAPARRGRVARAHAAIKRHPEYNEHAFCVAVETAFMQWEALQNVGH